MHNGILNVYQCSECGAQWAELWSCSCNSECLSCRAEIEPEQSEDVLELLKARTRVREVAL